MYLCDGRIGNDYKVEDIKLPVNIEKRLEALGMTHGTSCKNKGDTFRFWSQYYRKYFSEVTNYKQSREF